MITKHVITVGESAQKNGSCVGDFVCRHCLPSVLFRIFLHKFYHHTSKMKDNKDCVCVCVDQRTTSASGIIPECCPLWVCLRSPPRPLIPGNPFVFTSSTMGFQVFATAFGLGSWSQVLKPRRQTLCPLSCLPSPQDSACRIACPVSDKQSLAFLEFLETYHRLIIYIL